jgi:hypothetical protein
LVNRIKGKDFDTDPEAFLQSLLMGYAAVDEDDEEYEIPQSVKTYKVKGQNAGFALSEMKGADGYTEVIAVHNASPYPRLGPVLLTAAIELGGGYLECVGEHLMRVLYKPLGFEVYKTLKNIKLRNGQIERLYFMKLKWVSAPNGISK